MVLIIVILVLLFTLAFFYLKCTLMQSVMTLWSSVIATIIAFSFYERVGEQLISRGIGLDWALAGIFIVLYVFGFAVFRVISDFLLPGSVDLGDLPKSSAALACGFLTGLIISGNLLVALGLVPLHGKVFYSRFDPEASVVLSSPRTPALSTDGFVTGLYRWFSSGSMSSGKSFGVLHANYLNQIHLNKLKTKELVLSVCSPEALILPQGKAKKPVRYRTIDDKQLTIVRAGVKTNKIEDGGAGNELNKLVFFPAQIRMIVKDSGAAEEPLSGGGTALYPVAVLKNGKVINWELNQIVTPDPEEITNRVYWVDLVFESSRDKKPILLGFKQNAIVKLPDAVDSTPDIERALNDTDPRE